MLGVFVLMIFLSMVIMVCMALAACYSLARGMWFGAAFGAIGAIVMLHVISQLAGQIETAYAEIKIVRELRGLDQ